MIRALILAFVILALSPPAPAAHGDVREYHLTIAQSDVVINGTPRHAMTINGTVPGPVLRFTLGDEAVIHVHNTMKESTSLHWHGLLVPNDQDGVPLLTTPPIESGTTFYLLTKASGKVVQLIRVSDKIAKADSFDGELCVTTMRGDWWPGFYLDMGNVSREGSVKFPSGKKPVRLLSQLVEYLAKDGDTVMDFFAGSGTTWHAAASVASKGFGSRRVILVQFPELVDPTNPEQREAAKFCDDLKRPRTIAELTKERLRRAGKKIKEENPLFAGDLGFRVFKLASSNIQAWEPNRDKLAETLEASIEHLKTDRTEQDILFELLLKLGLDLCVPIERRKFAGKEVHAIGGGVLFACLAEKISRTDVEALAQGIVAWNKEFLSAVGYTDEASKSTDAKKNIKDDKPETTCVFRDSGFVDDVAKTNLAAILHQHGLETVRSL